MFVLWSLSTVDKGGLDWSSQQIGQVGQNLSSSISALAVLYSNGVLNAETFPGVAYGA